MGDNLLLMDSPMPRGRSTVLPGRRTNRDHALLEQADSPCGVDKLLNFTPSKLNEVNMNFIARSTHMYAHTADLFFVCFIRKFKGATSRIGSVSSRGSFGAPAILSWAYVTDGASWKKWPFFSSSPFSIRLNLLHPQPSLFLFDLLSPLWCFSTLVNYIILWFPSIWRWFFTSQKWLKTSWHSSEKLRDKQKVNIPHPSHPWDIFFRFIKRFNLVQMASLY